MKAARILVVDDDLWIQRTSASVLGQQGHQVSLAGDAPSAFALASRIRPDAIVTTVSLPALDGWSWWERLRALPACARTPIVFLLPPGDAPAEVSGVESRRPTAAQAVPGGRSRADHRSGAGGTAGGHRDQRVGADAATASALGRSAQAVRGPPPAVRAARRAGSDLAVERAHRPRDGAQERHPDGRARPRDGAAVLARGAGSSAPRSTSRRCRARPPSTRC